MAFFLLPMIVLLWITVGMYKMGTQFVYFITTVTFKTGHSGPRFDIVYGQGLMILPLIYIHEVTSLIFGQAISHLDRGLFLVFLSVTWQNPG
jgi:hypothetical protein